MQATSICNFRGGGAGEGRAGRVRGAAVEHNGFFGTMKWRMGGDGVGGEHKELVGVSQNFL